MSEESDVDLDMEGVVEVSFNIFYLMHEIRQNLIFLKRKDLPKRIAERQQVGKKETRIETFCPIIKAMNQITVPHLFNINYKVKVHIF